MVWGTICSDGSRSMVWVNGNIDSQSYCRILDENLFEKFDISSMLFQHDNAPSHISKYTQNFLENRNLELLPWPPYSPDINIIEKVWALIKDHVYKHRNRIKTQEDLWEETKRVFLGEECDLLIQKLYRSLPERIDDLVKEKGGYID